MVSLHGYMISPLPNPAIIIKLERALGAKLPRPPKVKKVKE